MIGATAAINGVFAEVETAFDNTLSRDGSSPNTMLSNLDMNSYRILNLPSPLDANDPARLTDVFNYLSFPSSVDRETLLFQRTGAPTNQTYWRLTTSGSGEPKIDLLDDVFSVTNVLTITRSGSTATGVNWSVGSGGSYGFSVNGSNVLTINGSGLSLTSSISAINATLSGNLSAVGGAFSGNVTAVNTTLSGNLVAVGGTFSGNTSAVNGTFSGTLSAVIGTFTGKVTTAAPGTAAGFNLTPGSPPGTPVNGDLWATTTSVFARINGATKTLAALETAQDWTGLQTFSGGIVVDGGTVVIDTPTSIVQTWNNASTVFTGFKIAITDTTSAAGSKPLSITVGASEVFSTDKTGKTTALQFFATGYVVSPAVYGGGTASATLSLMSTYGVGTTDSINIYTGSQVLRWKVNTSGHLLAGTDATYDIGASGATRPRNAFLSGNITIGDATALIKSSVAMNNGAGANTATLTNAPAATNPTKWIPINDNGTTRYIPAW